MVLIPDQKRIPRRRRRVMIAGTAPEKLDHETPPPNLCQIIERSGNDRICSLVDFASGAHSEPWGHAPIKSSKPLIALRDLLTPITTARSVKESTSRLVLTIQQKATLAVVLACSILQLSKGAWGREAPHEGPWLQREWTTNGIYFLQTYNGEPNLDHPYLPINIDEPGPDSRFEYPTSSIFALAFTLLHLQDYEVIETLDLIRKDMVEEDNGVTPYTDYCAVLVFLETNTFKTQVDDQFQRAISACLTGRLADNLERGDEWAVQQHFSREVIVPLKEYLERLQAHAGIKPHLQGARPLQDGEREWCLLADSNDEIPHPVDAKQLVASSGWGILYKANFVFA